MLNKVKAATDTLGELFLIYAVLVLTCAIVFSAAEGKDIGTSIYWAGVTATSVGYGDVSPQTVVGRITGLFLAHASILIILPLLIARMASKMIDNPHEFTNDEQHYILNTCKMMQERLSNTNNNSQPNQAPPPPDLSQKAKPEESFFRIQVKG